MAMTRPLERRTLVPFLALSLLGATGCQQLAQTLAALAATGATPATTTPSTLTGTGILGTGAANGVPSNAPPPSLLGAQANSASPAAVLPAPVGATQEVQRLSQKFGVRIAGSCAEGRSLQSLEAGLSVFQVPQRFQGVTYHIPCQSQDLGSASGEWTGELTNGPYQIDLLGPPFASLDRSLLIHETGHHLHLAHTNPDIKRELESNTKATPEYYPSDYSKPGADGRPAGTETFTKSDGTQVVFDMDKVEQIAELIAYCKELANGGVMDPLPGDTPNWQCPASLVPVTQSL